MAALGINAPAPGITPALKPDAAGITLKIVHPEKEREELCEVVVTSTTTLDDLKAQICARTGLQARIMVMAKRYDAGDDTQRAALRAQAYANWVPAEPGDTLGSVGYEDGDRCAFTHLGQAQEDLHQEFQAAEEVELSSSDSSDDEDPRSPRPNRSPVRR